MKQFLLIVKRNIKMYFKDKGLFISSLITPLVLLVLYATFLAKVYKDSFTGALPEGLEVADKLINGCVGGELLSSLLAVCSVTVAFCSNIIMFYNLLRTFAIQCHLICTFLTHTNAMTVSNCIKYYLIFFFKLV